MRVAAFAALERHRDDLAELRVVAEAGRVRHADEFVFDDITVGDEQTGVRARSFTGSVR